MEIQRDSKFMRALFAALIFSAVFRLTARLAGQVTEQRWLTVALAVAAGAAAAVFIWRMYRVYERDTF